MVSEEDNIKAVDLTLTKWSTIKEKIKPFFNRVDRSCGFCEFYKCALKGGDCPAKEVCDETRKIMSDIEIALIRRVDKTLEWLEIHKEDLASTGDKS